MAAQALEQPARCAPYRESCTKPPRRRAAGKRSGTKVWDRVIEWCEQNRGLIVQIVTAKQETGPYDWEDFTQEAYLVVHEQWTRWPLNGITQRFAGYVVMGFCEAFRNSFAMHKEAPPSLQEDPDPTEPYTIPIPGEDSGEENEGILREALDWMTPQQRRAWALRLGYDDSGRPADYKEIAVRMGISHRAVHRLMARGQAKVEACARERGLHDTQPDAEGWR